jgi:hypothetical protein
MNGIEIIEIRALHTTKNMLETELQRILSEVEKVSAEFKVKIYSRINLETDFVVLIMNESDLTTGKESQLGILLSEGLKDYGMVNYSKWHELPATRASLKIS